MGCLVSDATARQLASARAPWWVAGGWALEAHRGRMKEPSREHSDLDLALLRPDLPAMRHHLSGWELDGHARSWLIASIERVPPGHAWLVELRA